MAGLLGGVTLHALFNGLPTFVLGLEYGFDKAEAFVVGFGDVFISAHLAQEMQALNDRVANGLELAGALLIAGAAGLWLRTQARVLREELRAEVEDGFLTTRELELIAHPPRRARKDLALLRRGDVEGWRAQRRRYSELVDLAFLKRRLRGADPEGRIARKRALIGSLSSA